MNNEIILQIQLFGCLRKYNAAESLTLKAISGETVLQIKKRLLTLLAELNPDFNNHEIIDVSALAHTQKILADDQRILTSGDLAVLPPVCGG